MDYTTENYPEEVKQYLQSIYTILKESDFFKENEIEKNGQRAFNYIAGPQFMKRWLDGDLETIIDEDDTLELMLKQTIALSVMFDIEDKGMVAMLDDENGEDFFYLTESGKKYKKRHKI